MEYSKENSVGRKRVKAKKVHKKKGDAQRQLFVKIWAEREPISELSGKYLGDEINACFFAHILGKGAYPQAKLDPDNIMLVTFDEHYKLDHQTHLAKNDPMFDMFFIKYEQLKVKYNH